MTSTKSLSIAYCLLFSLSSVILFSCRKQEKDPTPETNIEKIPFAGTFVWNFSIPGMGDQESTHIFYPDSVLYTMAGPVHSTSYTQVLVSYDPIEQRLITVGAESNTAKKGVYFVMFFKDVTDGKMTIYKRECALGLEEAQTFSKPADNATADYGWNEYIK